MTTIQCLDDKIESLRKLMIQTALTHGFSSPLTVKVSQELDTLLLVLLNEKSPKD